ncbi:MAG TPA: DUF4157 domain-containing protein [Ferruginibacter sp.]|nr:DUF4157 domain-containing protein [Ferruginibacter sp.]
MFVPQSKSHVDEKATRSSAENNVGVGKELSAVSPLQMAGEDEEKEMESVQGKFETIQRAGEDEEKEMESVQGKFETIQRAGEDEEKEMESVQGKFETIQRAGEDEEKEMESVQGKFKPVQMKGDNQTGMPDHLKSGVENLSGHSMDDVKVHFNSAKPAQLNALAYAQGTDIHVASGQEKHLPHEAWHVAQQKQGRVQPTMQMKEGVPVNDDAGLESEADVMGAKANSMR